MIQKRALDKLLGEHPFFEDIDKSAREIFAGCAKKLRVNAGDFVYRENEPADHFYLIRHGLVAVESRVPGRDPLVVETLGDGDILGWAWMVPPYKWRFDARAQRLTRLISMDAVCLRGKCESDHSLGYQLYQRFLPVMANTISAQRLQLMDLYGAPEAANAE